ncbi:MAG: glycosyltransferase family 2 protein [Chitinispirillaceae bacterium]|nr:glycosyltransferase family 2 protein [Chitinispirillaceae bacterium]
MTTGSIDKKTTSAATFKAGMEKSVVGKNGDKKNMLVSLAAPVYNEISCVHELYRRLSAVGKTLDYNYEIVLVDDGSTDGTREYLVNQTPSDPHLRVIGLSRNFGLQASVSACLFHAKGDVFIILDGDLQDPPELIPDLIYLWEQGNDIVYTVKLSRNDTFLRKLLFSVFYSVQQLLVAKAIPSQAGNFSLLDKKVVVSLRSCGESNRYFPGLRAWCGFKQAPYYYHRDARFGGKPKMSFFKLVKLGLDGIFNYTRIPLQVSFFLGSAMLLIAGSFVIAILYCKLVSHTAIAGWASTNMTVCFIGGVQLVSISILGEYIFRIFANTVKRPDFVVDRVFSSSSKSCMEP